MKKSLNFDLIKLYKTCVQGFYCSYSSKKICIPGKFLESWTFLPGPWRNPRWLLTFFDLLLEDSWNFVNLWIFVPFKYKRLYLDKYEYVYMLQKWTSSLWNGLVQGPGNIALKNPFVNCQWCKLCYFLQLKTWRFEKLHKLFVCLFVFAKMTSQHWEEFLTEIWWPQKMHEIWEILVFCLGKCNTETFHKLCASDIIQLLGVA